MIVGQVAPGVRDAHDSSVAWRHRVMASLVAAPRPPTMNVNVEKKMA